MKEWRKKLSFSWVQASKRSCKWLCRDGYEGQEGGTMREVKRGRKEENRVKFGLSCTIQTYRRTQDGDTNTIT